MQPTVPILFALDMKDIGSAIIPILVVVFWVLSQVLGSRKKPGQPPQRGAPPQPRQAPENVSDEIEAFLRQVTRQRGAGPAKEVELLDPELVAEDPPRVRQAPVQAVAVEPVDAQLVPEEISSVLPSRGKVASHVDRHIGSSSFAEEVSHLGEVVDQADEKVEERIQEKFDHQVGHLANVDASAADAAFDREDDDVWEDAATEPTVAAASQWTDFVKDRDSIRRAIILGEILRSPAGRW